MVSSRPPLPVMNKVWRRCAEQVSLDLNRSFWTNSLPRMKNEATIEVFARQDGEESDWETTTYGLSKRLVSRSKFYSLASAGLVKVRRQRFGFGRTGNKL